MQCLHHSEPPYHCMPPLPLPRTLKREGFNGFLMGEPHSISADGLLYMAFIRRGMRCYYYGLIAPR